MGFNNAVGEAIYEHGLEAVPETYSNITASQSNYLRIHADNDPVFGQAKLDTPHVHFRCPWLLLPAAGLLGTMTLLVGTIWKTSKLKLPLWKNSVLAMMMHGFGIQNAQIELDAVNPAKSSAVQDSAAKIKVRFCVYKPCITNPSFITKCNAREVPFCTSPAITITYFTLPGESLS